MYDQQSVQDPILALCVRCLNNIPVKLRTFSEQNSVVMSNWNKLKQKIVSDGGVVRETRKEPEVAPKKSVSLVPSVPEDPAKVKMWGLLKRLREKAVALDCEMVGTGPNGKVSELARCSIVDYRGNVVYDEFVQPKGHVTDFRTRWSGIRKGDISKSNAVTFEQVGHLMTNICACFRVNHFFLPSQCQQAVAEIIRDKLLIGHAISNDFNAILLSHPRTMLRDTSRFVGYMRCLPSGKKRPRALKDLTREFLGKSIQGGEHDSVEDARCTMELYLLRQEEWETGLRDKKRLGKNVSVPETASSTTDVVGSSSSSIVANTSGSSSVASATVKVSTTKSADSSLGKRNRLFFESADLLPTGSASNRESHFAKRSREAAQRKERPKSKQERRLERKNNRRQDSD